MSQVTNRGCRLFLGWGINRQDSLPAQFFVYLATSATALNPDTEALSDISEIVRTNGYAPQAVNANTTDFFGLAQDDLNDYATVTMRDVTWNASGGPIPATGSVRYAVFTTNEPNEADRQVIGYWDFVTGRSVANGEAFTIETMRLRLKSG